MDLLNAIKTAAQEANEASDPACLVFGEVTNTSPLTILINNSYEITEAFIVLTRNVTDYDTTITFASTSRNKTETETINTTHNHGIPSQSINSNLDVSGTITGTDSVGGAISGSTTGNATGSTTIPSQNTQNKTFDSQTVHDHDLRGEKDVTINNHLVVGDKVIILRDKGGQKYLVIDRIG